MNIKIKISVPEFRQKLAAFKDHHAKLDKFMKNLETAIKAITMVSWVSPASKALLVKLNALLSTVRTALRIVAKYISDLENAIKLFSAVEDRAKQKMDSLKTDIFNV